MVAPTPIVPGQADELILGTNVIKYVIHRFKESDRYWEMVSRLNGSIAENNHFLTMLAGMHRCRGDSVLDSTRPSLCRQVVNI